MKTYYKIREYDFKIRELMLQLKFEQAKSAEAYIGTRQNVTQSLVQLKVMCHQVGLCTEETDPNELPNGLGRPMRDNQKLFFLCAIKPDELKAMINTALKKQLK